MVSILACLALAALPPISVSLNVPEGAPGSALEAAVVELHTMGVRHAYVSGKWKDMELSPGKFDFAPVKGLADGVDPYGYQVAVTLQTLDTNNRTLPSDLEKRPLDDPNTLVRFRTFVAAFVKALPKSVRWLSLGNEVDIYLRDHPEELKPYLKLIEVGSAEARSVRPDIKLGVTTTFSGFKKDVFERLNAKADVVFMTYYPLDDTMGVRPPDCPAADFAKMAGWAGKKPMILQEVGYPAAELIGSSDAKQAEFFRNVFRAAASHSEKIQLLNVFLLVDFDTQFLDVFEKYYRLDHPRFRAFLATLGLKRKDGTPRPAYQVVKAAIESRPKN